MDADRPHVFFSGQYTYRNFGTAFAGLFFVVMGWGMPGFMVVNAVQEFQRSPMSWGRLAEIAFIFAFVGSIGGFLGFAGVWLLKRWWIGKAEVEITSEGIREGKKFRSWDEIEWVGGSADDSGERIYLTYGWRGKGNASGLLQLDTNPTVKEYEQMMESLRRAISASHPEVDLS